MIFRRIILCAVLLGLVAGLLLSVVQSLTVTPIILAAEVFEIEEVPSMHSHHDSDIVAGSEEEWAPGDGGERTIYTVIANISAGIGFAAILLAVMSQLQSTGITQLSVFKGFLWGIAGFVVFFVVPGLGLPPEIPGVEAAPVEHRQLWWILAVVCSGLGVLTLVFVPMKFKLVGAIAIAIPFLVNAPHHTGPAFSHPDAAAVESLTQLHQQFIIFSGISNFLFWIVLGVFCSWALNRWVLTHSNNNSDNDVNKGVIHNASASS
ncbi:MAG: CbtA family protein [Pseudomonadales bacterium]|nr:CbtA family protein [Pseudomonadales bacterium]